MPLNPLIPLSVNPPRQHDLLSDIGQIRQIQGQNLALQQAREEMAATKFVGEALQRNDGDMAKALPEIMKAYPTYGYDIQQRMTAGEEAAEERRLRVAGQISGLKKDATNTAYTQMAGLFDYSNEPPKLQYATNEHTSALAKLLRQSQSAQDPAAAQQVLEHTKQMLSTQGQEDADEEDLESSEIYSLIKDETDPNAAIQKLEVAGLSPREVARRKLQGSTDFASRQLVPGVVNTQWSPPPMPGTLDDPSLTATLEGTEALKNYQTAQAQRRQAATQPLEEAAKWNTLLSQWGGGVTDQASAQAMRQEFIAMKAPASVVARIPAQYTPEGWQRFMNTTLTEEQRQTNADRVKGRNLEQQRIGQTAAGNADVIQTNAAMLVRGDTVPSLISRQGGGYNAVIAEADKQSMALTGKHYNPVQEQLNYEAAKRFVGSLNGNNMVRFKGLADSVVNTIDEVRRISGELKQGSVQLWNRARRTTIQQVYGNTPQSELANQYIGAVNTLKEEFANLANGGFAPTEAAWSLANAQINGDFGFKDLDASLTEVQRLINYRVNGIFGQSPTFVGGGTSGVAQQLGGAGGGPGPVGGGAGGMNQYGLPAAGGIAGEIYTTTTFPGTEWIWQGGQWVRTK